MESAPVIFPLSTDSTAQLAEIRQLLAMCSLPTADIAPPKPLQFFGCRTGNELVGIIGLEVCGPIALLRSLAVAPTQRMHGLGTSLVTFSEAHAAAQGIESLYLITTTAAAFFSKLGYSPIPREDVPASIKATTQYSELCPASATCMSKHLRS